MGRPLLLVSLALLLGCPTASVEPEPPTPDPDAPPVWETLQPGALQAGASTGFIDVPVGVPLSGFTGRDQALGSDPGPDARDSDYSTDFQASAGWQTALPVQAIWLTDGTRHSVLVRLDLIYSFDELTEEIGRRLSEATGLDLTDSIFTVTSHSHSSPGTFSNATLFFLGSDVFSREIFDLMVDGATAQALTAFAALQPAKIGVGIDLAFDPIGQDTIFADRREENNDLRGADGQPTGPGWKDQRATVVRIDAADGGPIAALFAFGIHGTIMGGDNTLASTEAGGHISLMLQERFGGPVWMFAQGAGGDASPAGRHSDFARMEWLAEEAAGRVVALYEATSTSADPLVIEPVQRYVPQDRQSVRVTRNGTELLEYEPWDPSWTEFPPFADEEVFDADGNVLSPLDEFWPEHGAALCGDPSINLPTFNLGVELPQYKSCVQMVHGYILFRIAFPEYFPDRETSWQLPLDCTRTAMLGALGLRDVPVTTLGGTNDGTVSDRVVLAFAPGEPTTLWTQFLRERARAEQGVPEVVVLGYAMDHEGYLMTTEDWLQGGYEASITVWGPLQGDAMLERFLDVLALADSAAGEDPNWPDWPGETVYPDRSVPRVIPDATPTAGQVPGTIDEQLYVRRGTSPPTQAQPLGTRRRMQDVARFVVEGNDPAMGNVRVTVQRETAPDVWEGLMTPQGHPIDDRLPDIIVAYTPLPLTGTLEDPDPERTHVYVAEWQPLDAWASRDDAPALPLGRYRFHVSGRSRDPGDTEPPFAGTAWEVTSEPFTVVPATVVVEIVDATDASAVRLRAQHPAPVQGYRLVHLDGDRDQPFALAPAATGVQATADGVPASATVSGVLDGWTQLELDLSGREGAVAVVIDDGYGNTGVVSVVLTP